jgi:hypothetical protein
MDQAKVAKKMINFYKTTFDSSFNALTILQEQAEKMVKVSLEQAPWFPPEGKGAVDEWVKAYKKGRDDFKSAVDENYKKVDSYFDLYKGQEDKTEKTKKTK